MGLMLMYYQCDICGSIVQTVGEHCEPDQGGDVRFSNNENAQSTPPMVGHHESSELLMCVTCLERYEALVQRERLRLEGEVETLTNNRRRLLTEHESQGMVSTDRTCRLLMEAAFAERQLLTHILEQYNDAAALAKESRDNKGESEKTRAKTSPSSHLQDLYRLEQVEDSVEVSSTQLLRLRSTNVLNDVFHIWHKGPFGTICGCRVGRYSTGAPQGEDVQIPWSEVNSGLGYLCLLLSILCDRLRRSSAVNVAPFQIQYYQLLPRGSSSVILQLPNVDVSAPRGKPLMGGLAAAMITGMTRTLELHGEDMSFFQKLSTKSSFNEALCVLPNIFQQLASYMRTHRIVAGCGSTDTTDTPPFKVVDHTVGGYTMEYIMGEERIWTQAMKLYLMNVKWLMGVVESSY